MVNPKVGDFELHVCNKDLAQQSCWEILGMAVIFFIKLW